MEPTQSNPPQDMQPETPVAPVMTEPSLSATVSPMEPTPVSTPAPAPVPTPSAEPAAATTFAPDPTPMAASSPIVPPVDAAAAPTFNQAAPVVTPAENPGKTMGIVSMVLSLICLGLIGLILGIVALKKSKKVGMGNGFAVAGIILGILNIIFASIFGVLVALTAGATIQAVQDMQDATAKCESSKSEMVTVRNQTFTCVTGGNAVYDTSAN